MKLIVSITVLIINIAPVFAQSGWYIVNPIPASGVLNVASLPNIHIN